MLVLKTLKWSNFRSYGKDNRIDLHTRTLTQLLGDNGAGKTSIPLMLQEVLYGKNIRGVKKSDLANRYTEEKGYKISLTFEKDNIDYLIDLVRNDTRVTIKLYQNGEDISSHTATNTYKTIADIIGIADFKTFCQLTYQSTTDALDFLTATDTSRKRFLISLLDLSRYLQYHEIFKSEIRSIKTAIATVEGNISALEKWLKNYKSKPLEKKQLHEVPIVPDELVTRLAKLKADLEDITTINRKISNNNKYLQDLQELEVGTILPLDEDRLNRLTKANTDLSYKLKTLKKRLKDYLAVDTSPVCSTCGQSIPVMDVEPLIVECRKEIENVEKKAKQVVKDRKELVAIQTSNTEVEKNMAEYEKLTLLIDHSLPTETLDAKELTKESMLLSKEKVDLEARITKLREANKDISIHNASVDSIKQQIKETDAELKIKRKELEELNTDLTYNTILRDAFSTNGIVSYKIEASVKVLESTINTYLAEFSKFRIRFKLVGDKLNVEVFDDLRNIINIHTVSTGELGRINIATGLAIRKLLSTLTTTRLNFLFLDEIVGVLDAAGKERLFEILQGESLNTIIVAHEETHPLIPKIEIEKEGDVSSLVEEI